MSQQFQFTRRGSDASSYHDDIEAIAGRLRDRYPDLPAAALTSGAIAESAMRRGLAELWEQVGLTGTPATTRIALGKEKA